MTDSIQELVKDMTEEQKQHMMIALAEDLADTEADPESEKFVSGLTGADSDAEKGVFGGGSLGGYE